MVEKVDFLNVLDPIFKVTCHTRHVGPGSIFVAIDGFKRNGVTFIIEAIERGATQIILKNSLKNHCLVRQVEKKVKRAIQFCFVDDCRKALAEHSSMALDNPASKLKIIGITGTAGKTSVVFLIEHILSYVGARTALLGSIRNKILNKEIGFYSDLTTPESDYLHTFFDGCVKNNVEYVVMEVSSHAIALQRVHGIEFDAIGFTNLAPEHMDFHLTMDHYLKTKCRLFSQIKKDGCLVVNSDDAWGKVVSENCKEMEELCPLSLRGKRIRNTSNGTTISLDGVLVHVPSLFGVFNAYNVGIAYTICVKLGLNNVVIREALQKFPGVPGRLQKHCLRNGAIAFVDFAHKPSAFEAVLKALRPLTSHLIVLFGCGGDRDKTKRPVMGNLASYYADYIVVTDDNPRDEDRREIIKEICDGIAESERSKLIVILDRELAIAHAVKRSRSGSIIAILGKGHENYYLCKSKKYYFDDFEQINRY